MSEASFRITRRTQLGLLAAAAATPTHPAQAAPATLDLNDPGARLQAHIRMRSRLDGQRTFMPYRGTIFGKPEGRIATALFDVEGFSWTQAIKLADGRVRLDSLEAGYFLDLASGAPLTNWVNPLNGLPTVVKHYRSPSHIIAGPNGLEPAMREPPPPGSIFRADTGRPTLMDGKVWMHEDLIARFANKPRSTFADPLEYAGPFVTATSLATWSADLALLADPALAFVPTLLSYQTIGSWRPFMRMGETPGVISWRMFGVKSPTLEGVPRQLRDRVLTDYPGFLGPLEASGA